MKTLQIALLVAFLYACSSNSGGNTENAAEPSPSPQPAVTSEVVTKELRDSTVTFKAAQAACANALGSITFSLGHARAHSAPGVSLKENPTGTAGIITMVFASASSGKSATVEANGHNRSVTGKNVTVTGHRSIACIGAE